MPLHYSVTTQRVPFLRLAASKRSPFRAARAADLSVVFSSDDHAPLLMTLASSGPLPYERRPFASLPIVAAGKPLSFSRLCWKAYSCRKTTSRPPGIFQHHQVASEQRHGLLPFREVRRSLKDPLCGAQGRRPFLRSFSLPIPFQNKSQRFETPLPYLEIESPLLFLSFFFEVVKRPPSRTSSPSFFFDEEPASAEVRP